MDLVAFHGAGLQSGETCGVTLNRVPGPLAFVSDGTEAHRTEMKPQVVNSRLGVVLPGGRELNGIGPLFAALAGLGIQHGVRVDIEGPELPLLDAASQELALALRALAPPREAPRLRVVQSGEVLAGASRYSFEPGAAVDIAVTIDERPVGRQRAAWDGNPSQFVATLAGARLYDSAIPDEQSVIRQARGADPGAVLMLRADGRAEAPGADPKPDEVAQHRLLDLLADLYLFGGPPLGRIHAWQPEHRATHRAIRQALEFGLLAHRR